MNGEHSRGRELRDNDRWLSPTARWLEGFGTVELVGIEGTGSYGAGLTRHLQARASASSRSTDRIGSGVAVGASPIPKTRSLPLERPRAARRTGSPRHRDGNVEAMRVLRIARSSARRGRTVALNQMRSIISTAPDALRAELRDFRSIRCSSVAAAYRPGADATLSRSRSGP